MTSKAINLRKESPTNHSQKFTNPNQNENQSRNDLIPHSHNNDDILNSIFEDDQTNVGPKISDGWLIELKLSGVQDWQLENWKKIQKICCGSINK